MKIPVTIQMQPGENGAAALCMILGYYKRYIPLSEMREKCICSRNGISPEQLIDAAGKYDLEGETREIPASDLSGHLPVLVLWKKKYYAIIESITNDMVTVADPAKGEYRISRRKFEEVYSGKAIILKKKSTFKPGGRKTSLLSLISGRLKVLRRPMLRLAILTLAVVGINLIIVENNKEIIDIYLKQIDFNKKLEGFMFVNINVFLLLLSTILSLSKTRLVNRSSRDMSARSGSALFKKMFAQPMRFYEQHSSGDLMSRIQNNISVDNSIMQSLVPRVIDVIMTFVYIFRLLGQQSFLAGICLLIVVSDLLFSLRIQEKNAIAARSMSTNTGILNTSVLNGINMIDTIKCTGSERAFFNIWHDSQSGVNDSKRTGQIINAMSTLITGIHGYALQAVQLFLGAYFVTRGEMTLGAMALFQSILGSMKNSLSNCMSSVNTLQTMRTNIERVNDIVDRPVRQEITLPESEYENVDKLDGEIVVNNVTFRYNPGDEPALKNVSIRADKGQMIALVGKTGCGKSTLLKIIADLYQAQSGQILYSGIERKDIPDIVFHSSLITVDQEIMMFEDSVNNNIRMWDSTIEDYEVAIATKDAQIGKRISESPKGFNTMIEENGRNFSGGELQRLELARALSHEPTILLLDEFTSALDALTEDRVIKAIREKGTTCIIVAHRLSTIVDCDRIYVLDRGEVVQQGTHSELYGEEGLYRELVSQ